MDEQRFTIGYVCPVCGEGYVQPIALYESEDSYHWDKWFECNRCGQKKDTQFGVLKKVPLEDYNSQPWAPAYPYNLYDFEKAVCGEEELSNLENEAAELQKLIRTAESERRSSYEQWQTAKNIADDYRAETDHIHATYIASLESLNKAAGYMGLARTFHTKKYKAAQEKATALEKMVADRRLEQKNYDVEEIRCFNKHAHWNGEINTAQHRLEEVASRIRLLKQFF